MENVHLIGAEEIARAGTRMVHAVEEMSRAAELIAQVSHTLLVRIEALEEAVRESTGALAVHTAALSVLTEALQPPRPVVVPSRVKFVVDLPMSGGGRVHAPIVSKPPADIVERDFWRCNKE